MTDAIAEVTPDREDLKQAQRRSAAGSRRRRYLAVGAGWVGFLLLWWAASALFGSEARLPSPPRVLEEIRGILAGDFWNQFWASIVRVIAGFIAAIVIGTPLGFLMGRSRYWGNFLQAPVVVAGSIPGLTYAVLAFVIFGISFWGPVMAVGLISMPYVAINVAEGVHGVNRGLLALFKEGGAMQPGVLGPRLDPNKALAYLEKNAEKLANKLGDDAFTVLHGALSRGGKLGERHETGVKELVPGILERSVVITRSILKHLGVSPTAWGGTRGQPFAPGAGVELATGLLAGQAGRRAIPNLEERREFIQ